MKPTLKIGLFGGTFDPIHNAHLAIVEAAIETAELRRVLIMPSGHPPLKDPAGVSPAIYRYRMAELAVRRSPQIEISDMEIRRTGPSYTVDTLKQLNCGLGSARDVHLICGTDVLFDLPNWHEPKGVLENCTLLVGTRPGFRTDSIQRQMNHLRHQYKAVIQTFDMPEMDLSSTEIRSRLIEFPQTDLPQVPQAVGEFIRRHRVYRDHLLLRELSDDTVRFLIRVQQELWNQITRERLLHSVGTALTAVRLALRFGVDADKAAVAGILHDLAKELSPRDYLDEHPEQAHWLEDYPQIVHGPFGAQLARGRYGIDDQELLDAITYHTTLRDNPSNLEKIIFLSDKIEPSRTFLDLKPIRELARSDLNRAALACLEAVRSSILKRDQIEHPYSVDAALALTDAPGIPAIRKDDIVDD
ncbi:MAG: nicotinate-nucleotide adenylyltransferase [Fastidiosipilaceae bacterium]|jgi:nicotinate-nucleotide adenylyltransferase